MTRITGPSRPVRTDTPQDPKPTAETPKAAAPTARTAGFNSVSSFDSTSRAGVAKLTQNDLGVLAQDQGNTNACGTTSLANVMTFWGMPRTHEQIDASVRAFDLFSAPDKLVEYARDNGMRAELKADASLNDLAHMVDQGAPPIVLIDPDNDKNANLHYVTVTGYQRDASGKITDVAIADSAGGYRYTMPAEKFQQQWDHLKMGGVSTGLNNVMITAVPKDGRMVTGGDGVQRRASDLQLPESSFGSNLKSGAARAGATAIADGGKVASNIGKAVSKAWHSIFG